MVISDLIKSEKNTQDNIGTPDSLKDIVPKRNRETVYIEENSTIVSTHTIGHSWIVGSSTNGIVGDNTSTQDGQQQVVGSAGRVLTVQRIVNPNNTFREHFRDTTFKGSPCTADWNLTDYKLAMSTSGNHSTPYNTVATLSSIFYNQQTVSQVTVNAVETRWNPNDKISYFASANGGGDWTELSFGESTLLGTQGQDLRIKIIFFGNGGKDTYIEDLQVSYTI